MELMGADRGPVEHGPIGPEHARDGWQFEHDESGGARLSIRGTFFVATIYPTTSTTCAWSIYGPDGRMLREASIREVQAAKDAAAEWVREHS